METSLYANGQPVSNHNNRWPTETLVTKITAMVLLHQFAGVDLQ